MPKIKSLLKEDEILKTLLKNRGIKTEKEKQEFFNPSNPENLKAKDLGINPQELKKAITRIKKAIKNKEKIIVYGDYDVDGICATAIMWETLNGLGADVQPFIPDRFTEGYGLNIESIKSLKEKNPDLKLIITVDHGIVADEKVDFAKSVGVDVIITDHHLPGRTTPKAYAVVHTTKISGAAVSWFVCRELLGKWKLENGNWKLLNDHLGLAALGTVADVLPLVGCNRSIVTFGLDKLRTTQRVGLKALVLEAGIKQDQTDTFHIGFIIAPRLNAMGRIDHAMDGLRILCTKNNQRANDLAYKLGETNKLRQTRTEKTYNHINKFFGPGWSEGSLPKILFAHHESYDEGIIGIVAGRLVEKYHRPAIVLSVKDKISKASARSLAEINIIEIIKKAGEGILISAGGHPMAAGLTIKTQDLDLFAQRLAKVAEIDIEDKNLVKNTRVDMEIKLDQISQKLIESLKKFAPFGYGNPEPTFVSADVFATSSRLIGKDNTHLKLLIKQKNTINYEAIGFRMGEWYSKITTNIPLNIIYSIEENIWNGKTTLQLKLRSLAM